MTNVQPAPTPAPTVFYVSFSAEINPNTTESLIAALSQFVGQGAKEIHLLISTPGGSVMNGMNLYNVLRALPVKLVTHNVGNVDSIGNVIFLAGEDRRACPHSTFMFHGVAVGHEDGPLGEKSLREKLQTVQADQLRMAKIIEERTSIDPDEIAGLFLDAQVKDSAYAVSTGIVDQVIDVQIPAGAPVLALVFQR